MDKSNLARELRVHQTILLERRGLVPERRVEEPGPVRVRVLSTKRERHWGESNGHFVALRHVGDFITDFLDDASTLFTKDGGILFNREKARLLDSHIEWVECTRFEFDENLAGTGLWNLVLTQYELGTDSWEPERFLGGH